MSTGKHQPKSILDRLDANTLKLIIIAAAVIVVAAVIITAVVLITNDGGDVPTPPPPSDKTTEPSDDTGEDDPSSEVTDGTDPSDPTDSSDPSDPTDAPTDEPTDEPTEPTYYNPLTGLVSETDVAERKPYAVMFNNIAIATPQAGISSADVLFEVPVEGGITRFMGIYQDFKGALTLGSVRSARPYFVELAMSFDAVYIHAGGSNDAYQSFADTGIIHIDGVNGSGETFFRDEERVNSMGYEHSLMLNVSALDGYMEKYNLATTHDPGFNPGLNFAEDARRSGVACTEVEAVFNGTKSTSFSYDSETKLYGISQYGGEMIDSLTEKQVTARNIILLSVWITPISGDDAGRLRATLTGNGSGWLISDGVAERITWTRTSSTSQFVFTDSEGDEIPLSPGVTYIGLLPMSSGTVNFK